MLLEAVSLDQLLCERRGGCGTRAQNSHPSLKVNLTSANFVAEDLSLAHYNKLLVNGNANEEMYAA